jgi:hypothetical protein
LRAEAPDTFWHILGLGQELTGQLLELLRRRGGIPGQNGIN